MSKPLVLRSALGRGRLFRGALLGGAILLLTACGGAVATPTPLPPDVVRPQQPTPIYSTAQPRFNLGENVATPVFVESIKAEPTPNNSDEQLRAQILAAMLMNLPPSAMGVATGGATIFAEPNGAAVGSLPAGGTITVTGRSQDGGWLAVYTNDAISGWVPTGALRLFGADDLETVTDALSPAPVATMIAEAMIPPALSMADVIATRAAAPATPLPAITPNPGVSTDSAPEESSTEESSSATGTMLVGTVQTEGNLNLRATPATDGSVIAPLASASQLIATGRTPDGAWLQVRTPAGDGWVSAAFVALEGVAENLPTVSP